MNESVSQQRNEEMSSIVPIHMMICNDVHTLPNRQVLVFRPVTIFEPRGIKYRHVDVMLDEAEFGIYLYTRNSTIITKDGVIVLNALTGFPLDKVKDGEINAMFYDFDDETMVSLPMKLRSESNLDDCLDKRNDYLNERNNDEKVS